RGRRLAGGGAAVRGGPRPPRRLGGAPAPRPRRAGARRPVPRLVRRIPGGGARAGRRPDRHSLAVGGRRTAPPPHHPAGRAAADAGRTARPRAARPTGIRRPRLPRGGAPGVPRPRRRGSRALCGRRRDPPARGGPRAGAGRHRGGAEPVRPHLRAGTAHPAPGRAVTAGTLHDGPAAVGGVWADVVGQDAAVAQFRRAASPEGSLAQAWLITGPPGSGRSTAARAFAATLQCEQGSGCGRCPACRTTLAGTHPDVTVVATDKLSIAKEEVRALVMTAQRAPATGHRRVVIVEDADRMSAGTFNVLLKSIEEPPPATVWMLCAPSAEDLAPTIRSRCRLVTLSVPPSEVVAELLRRRDGIDDQLAVRAARAAQGHIGLALRYATQDGALAAREESARTLLS